MKEVLEGLASLVTKTFGAALLVVPALIPVLLFYGALQPAGRSIWSSGTRRKKIALAQRILSRSRYAGDKFYREIAEAALRAEK